MKIDKAIKCLGIGNSVSLLSLHGLGKKCSKLLLNSDENLNAILH